MRKISALFVAASMLTVAPAPVVMTQVHAAGLFETLFPRVRERRIKRQRARAEARRRQLERQRAKRLRAQRRKKRKIAIANSNSGGSTVKGPQYYTYAAKPLKPVRTSKLAKPFKKAKTALLAERTAKKQQDLRDHLSVKRMSLDAYATKPQIVAALPAMVELASALSSVKVKATQAIGKTIINHYAKSPEFLWIDETGQPNQNAQAVATLFAAAPDYGLRASDYALPAAPVAGDEASILNFEFALTARALRYYSDAKHGVSDPNRISGYHDFSKNKPNFGAMMKAIAAAGESASVLKSAHPKDPAFAALQLELASLAEVTVAAVPPVNVAPGTFIRPGMIDAELENVVELIRRRASEKIKDKYADTLLQNHSAGIYGPDVVALVKDMQKALWLKPDGIIGKNTIKRLKAGKKATPEDKRKKVVLAMERLRWHPDHLGNTHVFINQPSYRVSLKRNNRVVTSMNVVVGKRSNQTYFFHDKISYVEFNPYWGIPRSILVNEMLPKLRRNASYFDRIGYEVKYGGKVVRSASIDWYSVGSSFPFDVRQPPGPKNALGRLKIMFPNKHAIYMHDTPAKSLFSKPTRAYSHGCVRLERPEEMAAAVLNASMGSVDDAIASGKNHTRKLKKKIPVYVAYFTAWPTSAGTVKYYSDVYGRDAALSKAMAAEQLARDKSRGT